MKPVLTPEQALVAALANFDAAQPNERLIDASFGMFAERPPTQDGGAYHSLRFGRSIGNTVDDEHTYATFRERDREQIIRAWRAAFYPTAEETERRRAELGDDT